MAQLQAKKRIEWIDMAKGIGLILVVYGHVPFRPEWWNVWLGSFHMPLFFFLAGITYNQNKYKKFSALIKSKVVTLIIPYFIFAVLTFLWRVALQVFDLLQSGTQINFGYLCKQALGIFIQIRTTDFGVGVWFIPCIFVCFVLLYFILKISRNHIPWGGILLASLSLVAGYLYCTYIDIKLPWGIDAAFVAVFFMTLGALLRDKLIKTFNCKGKLILTAVAALAVNLIFTFLNYRVLGRTVGMWSNNYGNFFFFLIAALSGIVFVIAVTNLVSVSIVRKIGSGSIYYYGTHIILVDLLTMFMRRIPGVGSNDIVSMVISTVTVAAVLCVLYITYPLYERFYIWVKGKLVK